LINFHFLFQFKPFFHFQILMQLLLVILFL